MKAPASELLSFRGPPSLKARIEAARSKVFPGTRVTRTLVILLALGQGLDLIERGGAMKGRVMA
jgi:hypothetical protein